jgi:hypothetical protein
MREEHHSLVGLELVPHWPIGPASPHSPQPTTHPRSADTSPRPRRPFAETLDRRKRLAFHEHAAVDRRHAGSTATHGTGSCVEATDQQHPGPDSPTRQSRPPRTRPRADHPTHADVSPVSFAGCGVRQAPRASRWSPLWCPGTGGEGRGHRGPGPPRSGRRARSVSLSAGRPSSGQPRYTGGGGAGWMRDDIRHGGVRDVFASGRFQPLWLRGPGNRPSARPVLRPSDRSGSWEFGTSRSRCQPWAGVGPATAAGGYPSA